MRKATIMMMILVGLVAVAPASTIDLPWFDEVDGNPYTDGDGNVWTAAGATSYTNYDTSTYMTLPWYSSGYWKSGNMEYRQVTAGLLMRGANAGNETTVLVFAPAEAGEYSWYGSLTNNDSAGMKAKIVLVDGDTSTPSVLWDDYVYSSGRVLSDISALQNISLETNDKLLLMTTTQQSGYWGRLVLADAGMNFAAPEPVSMSIIGAGAIFVIFRCKRRSKLS